MPGGERPRCARHRDGDLLNRLGAPLGTRASWGRPHAHASPFHINDRVESRDHAGEMSAVNGFETLRSQPCRHRALLSPTPRIDLIGGESRCQDWPVRRRLANLPRARRLMLAHRTARAVHRGAERFVFTLRPWPRRARTAVNRDHIALARGIDRGDSVVLNACESISR
jgi:hypothetical protein